jgi:hypothetical protein
MLFRIIAPHTHKAIIGKDTFVCLRALSEPDLAVSWSAAKNDVVLKSDCRTLNEAKKVCREAAGAAPS